MPNPPARPALIHRLAMPLAPCVTVLLWAQWPLRDAVGAGSSIANDIAQILFALYVAVALTWAELRQAHLVAHPQVANRHRWQRIGAALLPLPWCAWVLWTAAAPTWQSLRQAERFAETDNPGYFLIKLALMLMALLLALHSLHRLTTELR